MAGKPIVIIHGWSDDSESFERLAGELGKETGQVPEQIWLGDYISLDDNVRIQDIACALHKAWTDRDLPTSRNAVDVIVHSTGGLVIREWMSKFYQGEDQVPPVQNLVMLAPANFGSPLAHKGRSIIGRVVKGHNADKRFQTGAEILKALEMASPFSWHLAQRDRFSSNHFAANNVRCTVIVGNTGYSGIKGFANDDGSDGTVYVSTANMNCATMEIRVTRTENGEFSVTPPRTSTGRTAFLVLDHVNHSEITCKERMERRILDPILKGLTVSRDDFPSWCDECENETRKVTEKYATTWSAEKHAFQNTVFIVTDDQGNFVNDYAIEFYGTFDDDKDKWAEVFNKKISKKIHPYGDCPAYRSFMIDVSKLRSEIDRVDEQLRISLTAVPDLRDDDNVVGYRTSGIDDIGQVILSQQETLAYFQPHRTLYVNIELPRYQKDEVFQLENLADATD